MTVKDLKFQLLNRTKQTGGNPNYPEKDWLCIAKNASGNPLLICKVQLEFEARLDELEIINEFPTKAECDLVENESYGKQLTKPAN